MHHLVNRLRDVLSSIVVLKPDAYLFVDLCPCNLLILIFMTKDDNGASTLSSPPILLKKPFHLDAAV
jgi:hypothetical protein